MMVTNRAEVLGLGASEFALGFDGFKNCPDPKFTPGLS